MSNLRLLSRNPTKVESEMKPNHGTEVSETKVQISDAEFEAALRALSEEIPTEEMSARGPRRDIGPRSSQGGGGGRGGGFLA